MLLAGLVLPALAQIRVLEVPITSQFGSEKALRVFNDTARGVNVFVDYIYDCPDGSRSSASGVAYVRAHGSADIRQGCVPLPDGSADGMQHAYVTKYRWQLSPSELAADAAAAEAQQRRERLAQMRQREAELERQRQEETDRKRREQCFVDEQGHFDTERFRTGVPSRCDEWFPQLKIARKQFRKDEQARAEANRLRLQEAARGWEVDAERKRMAAMRAKLEANQREDARERQRLQDEERRRAESERAWQEQQARDQRDMEERGARARIDPCGAVTDMRSRPPKQQAYPPNANAQAKATVDRYNAQLVAQWQHAINEQVRRCSAVGNANPAPAVDPQARAAAAAEAARRERAMANAQADLERAQAQGSETVRRQVEKTQAMDKENDELLEMIKKMK